MSILIKGMEMPKDGSCVTVRIWGDGRVVGVHNDSFVKQAISVQTPHGDLIDEVIRELGLNCCYEMPSFWTNNRKDYKVIQTKYHKGYLQALEDVEKAIKQRITEGDDPLSEMCDDCEYDHCTIADSGTCEKARMDGE